MAARVYLKFLHFSLHGYAVHHIDAAGHGAETVLGHAQPIREGAQDTLGILNARHLLLELLDGLLQDKRTEDPMRSCPLFTEPHLNTPVLRSGLNKCCCIY